MHTRVGGRSLDASADSAGRLLFVRLVEFLEYLAKRNRK
jgi:hypothetical protein